MISQETIKKLAIKYQTTELNIIREYFQHVFLQYFYKQKQSDKIYFKGGTALRMIYQSPRFSEDLDMSSEIKNISIIEEIVLVAISEIEREGIETEIKEAKKTSGGYLAIIHFLYENQMTPVQLEISLRKKEIKGEIVTIVSDFLPPYTIVQLSLDELVEEKIKAVISRKKSRDFYDIYFLLRANLISTNKKKLLSSVAVALDESDISFSKELKIFLPKSHWPIIKNFQDILKREISRHITFSNYNS